MHFSTTYKISYILCCLVLCSSLGCVKMYTQEKREINRYVGDWSLTSKTIEHYDDVNGDITSDTFIDQMDGNITFLEEHKYTSSGIEELNLEGFWEVNANEKADVIYFKRGEIDNRAISGTIEKKTNSSFTLNFFMLNANGILDNKHSYTFKLIE